MENYTKFTWELIQAKTEKFPMVKSSRRRCSRRAKRYAPSSSSLGKAKAAKDIPSLKVTHTFLCGLGFSCQKNLFPNDVSNIHKDLELHFHYIGRKNKFLELPSCQDHPQVRLLRPIIKQSLRESVDFVFKDALNTMRGCRPFTRISICPKCIPLISPE